VADGLKEATDRIQQVIAKSKKLISSVHMSCNATELLEKETGHNIPIANATRWSSMYQMIKALTDTEQEHNGILTRLAETTGSPIRFKRRHCVTARQFEQASSSLVRDALKASGTSHTLLCQMC